MKTIQITYHDTFPQTPISGWAGARWYGWVRPTSPSGQWRRPQGIHHPFITQRKKWCRMTVHYQDVTLFFAMPPELDQFIAVMSTNPLPSGHCLVPGHRIGRPNNHWLSRLPKQAKPWKFRRAICRFLETREEVQAFRDFYRDNPVVLTFDGVYDSYPAAARRNFGK